MSAISINERSPFETLLRASTGELLKQIYVAAVRRESDTATTRRSRVIAHNLGLTHCQLLCAAGFNAHMHELPDVAALLGFPDYETLIKLRNEHFVTDLYQRLGIKDLLALYDEIAPTCPQRLILQYLLPNRLSRIEEHIEATVNARVIERYKKEVRAIYREGIAGREFVETRLGHLTSGFRALVGEVILIAQSQVLPIAELFGRLDVLPEEKRRLITKGFVSRQLLETRLTDPTLPIAERRVLEEQLPLMP